ncbi:hypothetical protein [Komarekiella delphini-convector]|uniref:hypothetical protein n=1 Tax=Komarekiella delphini-convector TaxID=3050158 RepID=UPI00177EBE26|nr:hypothetical protein [Komarekiella delphini-convector]
MLEIQRIFNLVRGKIGIVLLAGLVWLISLPAASVQADGYYSEKAHKVEVSKPYYFTKERKVTQTEHSKPYYATNNHQKKANLAQTDDDYIEKGKRTTQSIPQELRSRSREKTEERRIIQTEPFKPYYASKERRIAQAEPFKPYYASKERQKKANVLRNDENYIDNGKRSPEVTPRVLRDDAQQGIP